MSSDGTIEFDADVESFIKQVNDMALKAESRFAQTSRKLASTFDDMFGGKGAATAGTSPAARQTKELDAQVKASRELLKIERDRAAVARAGRFDRNRSQFGEDVELNYNGDLKREYRKDYGRAAISAGGQGIGAVGGLIRSGGNAQGQLQFTSQIATMLAPEIAPVMSAVSSLLISALDTKDRTVEAGLRAYQVGGLPAAAMLLDPNNDTNRRRQTMGMDASQFSALQLQMAHGVGSFGGMQTAMMGETAFGIGGAMTGLMGSARRGGASSGSTADSQRLVGSAFGLAVSQGMERGRLGETFNMLSRAIDANTVAVTDISDTTNRLAFIGTMGAQYHGDTNAARAMNQNLGAVGSTAFDTISGLRAAGFGKGKSYQEAALSVSKGVGTVGGVGYKSLDKEKFGQDVRNYARAKSDAERGRIVQLSSFKTGIGLAETETILKSMANADGGVNASSGLDQFLNLSNDKNLDTDSPLMRVRQARVRGEQAQGGIADNYNSVLGGVIGGKVADFFGLGSKAPGQSVDGVFQNSAPSGANAGMQKWESPGGRFGTQRNGMTHQGEDLVFPPGTTVMSPCDGQVIFSNFFGTNGGKVNPGDGWALWIKDANLTNRVWKLYHLDPKTVTAKVKTFVRKGETLGKTLPKATWDNGVKTHLHVQTDISGSPVDPNSQEGFSGVVSPDLGGTGVDPDASSGAGAGTGAGAGDMSGSSGSGGGSTIKVIIVDKTQNGIDVKKETAKHAAQAGKSAPGDVPAMQNSDW